MPATNTAETTNNSTGAAKRPYFKLKSAWATWEAERVGKVISEMRAERIPSADWRGIRRKSAAIDRLEETRREWERRAAYYRRQEAGVTQPARQYGNVRPAAAGYR